MPITQISAIVATVVFIGMGVFQLLLATGFPLGKAAWGGKYSKLPMKLRVASLISMGVFIFAALIVLEKTGFISIFDGHNIIDYIFWGITVLFGFSAAGNLASKSILEKRIMTPIALILFLSCLVIAVFS